MSNKNATAAEFHTLRRNFKDVVYEMESLHNSVLANEYFPEAISKSREIELFFKGILLEIDEAENAMSLTNTAQDRGV